MKKFNKYVNEKLQLSKASKSIILSLDNWFQYIKDNGGDIVDFNFTTKGIFLQNSKKQVKSRNGKYKYSYPYFEICFDREQLEDNECEYFMPFEYNNGLCVIYRDDNSLYEQDDTMTFTVKLFERFEKNEEQHSTDHCKLNIYNADKILELLNSVL